VNEYKTAKLALIRNIVIFEAITKCLWHRFKWLRVQCAMCIQSRHHNNTIRPNVRYGCANRILHSYKIV